MLIRPRRNRKNETIRKMVEENEVKVQNLIYPLFSVDKPTHKEAIKSMPGINRYGLQDLLREVDESVNLGLNAFVLFPAVEDAKKDSKASYGIDENNFYYHHIRAIKERFPDVVLMSDVALDPYSSDGHDGIVKDGEILNDETLPLLAQMAVMQAQAGIDIIGPSDMMDGRVEEIRRALDLENYQDVSIMSYTAKYASAFYGPFRDALDSAPKSGDKKTYQMNPANAEEALIEAELDTFEGADFLMVKPALAYLDIIKLLKDHTNLPIAAYNVSGEYAMIKAAAQNNWLNYEAAVKEVLLSIKRAGATSILTYFAKDFAGWNK